MFLARQIFVGGRNGTQRLSEVPVARRRVCVCVRQKIIEVSNNVAVSEVIDLEGCMGRVRGSVCRKLVAQVLFLLLVIGDQP